MAERVEISEEYLDQAVDEIHSAEMRKFGRITLSREQIGILLWGDDFYLWRLIGSIGMQLDLFGGN